MRMRQEFVDSFSTLARDLHRSISGGREQLAVSYAPSVDAARYGGTEREALQEALYASALDDIRRGFTTMGPHRDDLSVCLGDAPVRVFGNRTIVTNGDQTDTIYELMNKQMTFEQALRTREFEPDSPNYTPRISSVMKVSDGDYNYAISILKSADGDPSSCQR